jgi:hypothetical protein
MDANGFLFYATASYTIPITMITIRINVITSQIFVCQLIICTLPSGAHYTSQV